MVVNMATRKEIEDEYLRKILKRALKEKWPLSCVEQLVADNPRVLELQDNAGKALLHFAIMFQASIDVTRFLLTACPLSVNFSNQSSTALHHACHKQAPLDIVQLLVKHSPETLSREETMMVSFLSTSPVAIKPRLV
jgi:ankyrin repeat protein